MRFLLLPNLLDKISSIFFLRDECTILPLFNLKTQEKCKFLYHIHFDFLLHFFKKLYSTGVYGGSKHYVINIQLSYKKTVLIFLHKQGLVSIPSLKSSIQEIICKPIIPCSRCLFQSIECLL